MPRCYTTAPPRCDHQDRSEREFRDESSQDQFDDHAGAFCNGSASRAANKLAKPEQCVAGNAW